MKHEEGSVLRETPPAKRERSGPPSVLPHSPAPAHDGPDGRDAKRQSSAYDPEVVQGAWDLMMIVLDIHNRPAGCSQAANPCASSSSTTEAKPEIAGGVEDNEKKRKRNKKKSTMNAGVDGKFVCKLCGKEFPTPQKLGGHCAGAHRKGAAAASRDEIMPAEDGAV